MKRVTMKIRLGLIGFGRHMSEKLIPALKKFSEVELVYGSCRTQRTLDLKKSELNLQAVTTNWVEMMSKDYIDAVIVAATPHVHEQVAKKAFESGIHAFIEKPLTLSLNKMKEITTLTTQHPHLVTAEGFNFQYVGMMKDIKQFGTHNAPLALKIHCASKGPQTPIWDTNCVSNSFLYAVLIHPISVSHFLYGNPSAVKLMNLSFDGEKLNGELKLSFAQNQIVMLDFNNHATCFEFKIDVTDNKGINHVIDASTNSDEKAFSYETQFKEFIEAIKNGDQPRNSFNHSFAIHKILAEIASMISQKIQVLEPI